MSSSLKLKSAFVVLSAVALTVSACGSNKKDSDLAVTANARTPTESILQTEQNPQPMESASCTLSLATPGRIADGDLSELSGLMYSKKHQVLWAHNDNGEDNRLFALSLTGERIATVAVADTTLDNWEDSAIVPGDTESSPDLLYLGSIGDNKFDREKITIFRVEEPALSDTQTQKPDRIDLAYPDRPRDAEALFVDPLSGDIFILQKAHNDGPAQLFVAAAPGEGDQTIALQSAGEIDFVTLSNQAGDDIATKPKPHLVTGADVSRDGKTIAIRTYGQVWIWERDVSEPLQKAFEKEPCQATSVKERQGEAIALTPNGDGYITVSEGPNMAVNIFE